MHDPRESGTRTYDGRLDYAETSVDQQQVFIPSSHVKVIGINQRAEMIQETYRLLAVAVFSAMASCWLFSRWDAAVAFMSSGVGFMLAFFGLNFIPAMALSQARKSSRNATLLLAWDGAFSGLCLSPLVYFAMLKSGVGHDGPNLVQAALLITASVFLGISGYVYQSAKQFSYAKGMMCGFAWVMLAAIPINAFMLHSGAIGLVIMAFFGLLGAFQLLWATSSVLHDPDFNEPAYGALCLFAGLFNIFTFVLRLLVSSRR